MRIRFAKPDWDYAVEKATWDLQATPVIGVAAIVLALAAVAKLVQSTIERLSRAPYP